MKGTPLMIRIWLGALLGLPVAAVLVTMMVREPVFQRRSHALPVLAEVSEFSLVQADRKPLTFADLRGKVWVASFIFTRCAGACPVMSHHLSKLQGQLPVRNDVRLVSVSVDPEHDTPEVLTKYAADYHADRGRWLFATGEKAQIYRLVRETFQLPVDDTAGTADEPILHSSKFVLIDRNGMIRGYYDGMDVNGLTNLVRDTERLLAQRS